MSPPNDSFRPPRRALPRYDPVIVAILCLGIALICGIWWL